MGDVDCSELIKRLRRATGESQQVFATRLGISIVGVSRFENGWSVPASPRMLVAFWKEAARLGMDEVVEEFSNALRDAIDAPDELRISYVKSRSSKGTNATHS